MLLLVERGCATTPSECAERLGVAVSLVRNWIKTGELKATDLAKAGSSRPRWDNSEAAMRQFEKDRSPLQMLRNSLKQTRSRQPKNR